ncbi:hypothetical protein LWI28_016562 [Acer negundo]|uniref:Uncharacterized protein n=1 Tax=Acer negundo TaxID=4023 RepID=A0AAD5JGN3_ACENE|nr:hypothetical protein LWI28_016562 [Acer negundo]
MLSLCRIVSRLSLATGTSSTRILKGKTLPTLVNSGIGDNRVIGTHTFSVKSNLDGDDGSGGIRNKENNVLSFGYHQISSDFDLSTEDLEVVVEWSFTNKESNAFLGGRHGKLVTVEVNSQLLEVPSGVLPSFINESDKEEMYRLHMEDQEFYTPEKLAKVYNTAAETVAKILALRDMLKNRKLQNREIEEMYRLNKENPEIYTIERLAKDFKFAQGTAHSALFIKHTTENPPWRKSSTSHGQQSHSIPLTRTMKASLARWSSSINNLIEEVKHDKEVLKKHKEKLSPECSDDEAFKSLYSDNELNSKCSQQKK